MHVITAIENEADYEGRFEEEDNAYALIDQYVRKVIEDTRKLSCPFIESPMGEAREPIDSCTFNIEMAPEKGDESPRAQLIRKELMNFGGSPDEDIPKNTIMFYQSFYGLRANDLSKFAPPEKSITYNRSSGEYFKKNTRNDSSPPHTYLLDRLHRYRTDKKPAGKSEQKYCPGFLPSTDRLRNEV